MYRAANTANTAFILSAVIAASVLLSASANTNADAVAHTCRGPASERVKAVVKSGACVGYEQLDAKGAVVRRVSFPFVGSGTMIASANGRTIMMVQSYLYGHIDENGVVESLETAQPGKAATQKNPVVIYVYRDGALVASHRADALFERKKLLRQSISHVRWVRSMPAKISGKRVVIETTGFRDIALDGRTGKLLSRRDSADWRKCDVIAVGQIDKEKNKLTRAFELKTLKRNQTIRFRTAKKLALPASGSVTACFKQRGSALVFERVLKYY